MSWKTYPKLIGLVGAIAWAGCSNLPQEYCAVGGECDDLTGLFLDPVPGSSSDSVDVCAVNVETQLAAWRANSESICSQAADAYEAYLACAIEEGCDAFKIAEPDCKDEYDDWQDLISDAQNRCNE